MFTGIIRRVGRVAKNQRGRLAVEVGQDFIIGVKVGSSIAVNGVCLTVVNQTNLVLDFDVIPETLRQTNLGGLQIGDEVNLERALQVGERWEGHIVQGHIDATARVKSLPELKLISGIQSDFIVKIEMPVGLSRFIVPKGFIAVDGVSLTVAEAGSGYFSIAVVPHTLKNTIIKNYYKGSLVNIEADIIGKYVVYNFKLQNYVQTTKQ